jgi:hypothetical protein
MADIVFDANAVGQVVTYVAPGFLARVGYRARYPGSETAPGEVLIISVVASLPLVAGVSALLPGKQRPTELGYVLFLLGAALALGYLAALLRGWKPMRRALGSLGYRIEPEGTIYAQTLKHMSDDAGVLVELKDGRRVWGAPRSGPDSKDDGIAELYLVYPEVMGDDGDWHRAGAGVIVPLAEVNSITLSEEPTHAPLVDAS